MDLYLGEPNEKQRLALMDTHKYLAYGGSRGSGKSWFVRTKAIILALSHKGIKILIMRQTYPELEQNHIRQLKGILYGIATYNQQQKRFTFGNGSTIDFQYCKNDSDLDRMQGSEYDVIFIDEATNFSEYQLKAIAACCRGVNNFPKRVVFTANPGGQGHGFFKRIFVDRIYEEGEDPNDYVFIQALVHDNKALLTQNADYIKQLEALPPKLKKAWLYGDWDIFEGQFFEDFVNDPEHYEDRKWTHVIEPFDIPISWNIYRSYDFGYSKPFSCAWWAVDHEGRAYRILELYGWTGIPNEGVKWSPDRQFQEIRKVEDEHQWLKGRQIQGVADPAIWQSDFGESVADVALKYRVYFTKGDNKRIPGWMQMHYRFQFDDNGYPMIYIFSNCKQFIRTVPLMVYDSTHVEDLDTSLEDHVCDETRYFCMSRPITPKIATKDIDRRDDPLNMHVKKRKNIYVHP